MVHENMNLMIDGWEDDEYKDFIAKFKAKKTTDDCYTPPNIYDAIADWVAREYGLSRADFVRPFFPGGDYQRFDYPFGAVVVDNPPFSILAEIVAWYVERGTARSNSMEHLTRESGNRNHVDQLANAVKLFATPQARDFRTVQQSRWEDMEHRSRNLNDQLATETSGQLNPTWVEWLMGFPIGWTDLDASETP